MSKMNVDEAPMPLVQAIPGKTEIRRGGKR